jgi:hypothetical protein
VQRVEYLFGFFLISNLKGHSESFHSSVIAILSLNSNELLEFKEQDGHFNILDEKAMFKTLRG